MLYLAFLILLIWTIITYKSKINTILFSIWTIVFFIFSTIYVVSNSFTWKWFDQSIMYHLKYWIWWAWIESSIEVIIVWIATILLWIFYTNWVIKTMKNKKFKRKKIKYTKTISFWLLIFSFIIHPLTNNILSLNWFYIKDIIKNRNIYDINFKDNYLIPEITKKDNTKNIVFIYLESFESLYNNEKIFPKLTPKLNKIKEDNINFSNISMPYMSYWTIAWMVGSQCWIPLYRTAWNENNISQKDKFLPNAYCIWDILKKDWYNLNYIGWADSSFAWKDTFYKTHWFSNIISKKDIEKTLKNKDYIHDWWIYDDTLLDEVYKKYDDLSKKNEKFWLFMITLDTHWDSWVISKSCNSKYTSKEWNILNAYNCNDYLIWNFIEKLKNHSSFKDTIIVLATDHYAMEMNNSINILQNYEDYRRLNFVIIDSDSEKQNIEKPWTTFDIWPTVLSKIWYNIKWLWLGRNLFDNSSLTEIYPNIDFSIWDKEYKKF